MASAIQPLIAAEDIAARVRELARQIEKDYANSNLTVLSVLTGSLMFTSDLIRQINLPLTLELVKVASYAGTSSGEMTLNLQLIDPKAIAGQDVLIVDDIIDTGKTISHLIAHLHKWNARSLRTAVLLNKHTCRLPDYQIEPDYEGFRIADKFVVGYGIDLDRKYRNLPYVGVVSE